MRKLLFAMVMTMGAAACAEVLDDPDLNRIARLVDHRNLAT
jgi:hypothetical protein